MKWLCEDHWHQALSPFIAVGMYFKEVVPCVYRLWWPEYEFIFHPRKDLGLFKFPGLVTYLQNYIQFQGVSSSYFKKMRDTHTHKWHRAMKSIWNNIFPWTLNIIKCHVRSPHWNTFILDRSHLCWFCTMKRRTHYHLLGVFKTDGQIMN